MEKPSTEAKAPTKKLVGILTAAVLTTVLVLLLVLGFISGVFSTSSNTLFNKVSYVAFSSDVHNDEEGTFSTRLSKWLPSVSEALGQVTFETMCFCGDYGGGNLNGDDYWTAAQKIMDAVSDSAVVNNEGIFTSGNHEYQNGDLDQINEAGLSANSLSTAAKIKVRGEALNSSQYVIYCFGAEGGSQKISSEAIDELKTYLSSAPTNRPIFILSHFPLHSISRRDASSYSGEVIDVLNEAAERGCNIVFLWGHNHTHVGSGEEHYDCVYSGSIDGVGIKFIYASAGCMGDNGGSVNGKGLVAKIENGQVSSLNYYDVDGVETGTGYSLNQSS